MRWNINVSWCQRFMVAGWWIALGLIAGNCPAQTSCVAPPTGLVGWWPGEGNCLDWAGTNNGTPVGGVSFVAGEVGQAFSFDGSSGYVQLPPDLFAFPFSGAGNTPFSFELWFRTASGGVILGQQQYPFLPFQTPPNYVPAIYIGKDGQLRTAMFWDGGANGGALGDPITATSTVCDGNFHHLAVVYDGTNQMLYVDSKLAGGRPWTQLGYATGYNYQFGTGCTGPGWPGGNGGWYWFNGLIDEPAMFNRALSAAEIAGIYAAGTAGMCPSPTITAQPQSLTNVFGGTSQFTVSAAGRPPLIYQWRINGMHLTNDTNATLTLSSVSWTDAGSYDVIVSNTYGAVTSQVAALTVNFSAGMPTNGLVSWWRGEGNPNDSVGTNDGVLMGGLSDEANGIIGRGFDFNGSDGFLSVPTFPNLGMSSFSLALWFQSAISSRGLSMTLFNKGLTFAGSPAYAGCGLRLLDGDLNLVVIDQTGLPSEISLNTPEPPINHWHHAAVTMDRTTCQMVLYLDGVFAAQTNVSALASVDTNIRMAFGALDRTPWNPLITEFFQGQMDEMMYFNRPLGAEEIESLYAAQGGQPRLDAQSSAGQALLSWSSACDGYALESCTNLSVNTWQTVTNGPCLAGCRLQVSLPANTPSQCFFRLHKPGR